MKSPKNTKETDEDLRLYKYIVSISEELMSFIGPDYTYQAVNEMYLKAHNKNREDIINHTIAELHGEGVFRKIIKEKIDRCFLGETLNFKDWFELSGAGRIFMDVTYYPYKAKEDARITGVVVVVRDNTAEKLHEEYKDRVENKLRSNQKRLKKAQEIACLGSWEWDLKTDITTFSDEYFRLFGFSSNESATREDCLSRIHADDLDVVNKAVSDALHGSGQYSIEYRINLPDGQQKYIHGMGKTEHDKDNQPIRFYGTVHDITKHKHVEELLQQHAVVFRAAREAVVITDAERRIQQVNLAFTKITGYSALDVVGKTPRLWRSERHDNTFYDELYSALEKKGEWQGEIWNRRKNGEVVPVWQSITQVKDDKGKLTQYISIFSDISEKILAEERIRHLAHYDVLTDLPNRLLFNERCEYSLARAKRDGVKAAVLFLHLDRFKDNKDRLGHPIEDELLQWVAERLKKQVRNEDTVSRVGGDEFMVILEQVSQPEDAAIVASKIIDELDLPFDVHGYQLHIGASIGISVFPDNGQDATTLIKNADAAMYRAKEQGRNRYEFYSTELTEAAAERVALEYQLRHALEKRNMILYYQPQVSISTGKVFGAEALIRMKKPDGSLVSPDQFIRLAEETGLIVPIGEWVLRTACEQLKSWQQQGLPLDRIAVNISAVQLHYGNFIETVIDSLNSSGLDPHCLELEITESMIMKETERAISILNELRELGVTIAIDDFGTGHSSLGQLKRLPIDKLKIDRSFVIEVTENQDDEAIIIAVLALGKSLGILVIAEGVETKDQLAMLKVSGCDEVQGYFYSPPVPPEEFIALL